MITLYHNPNCSKSRLCLSLLQDLTKNQKHTLSIRDYLQEKLNRAELHQLCQQLGEDVRNLIRDNDFLVKDDCPSDAEFVVDFLLKHPETLQRPIVLYKDRALIARPPELAIQLIQG